MSTTLSEVFARYPASAQPTAEPIALGNAGGFSGARLWRYDSAVGLLVLRRWPDNGPGIAHLQKVHGWLARADRLGFVPVPIAASDGRSVREVGGALWSVEPWKPGAAVATPSPAQVASAFTALAEFHGAMGERTPSGPSAGLAARVLEIEALLRTDIPEWHAIVDHSPNGPLRDLARRWLALAEPAAPGCLDATRKAAARALPIQPVIRDARPEHVLFTGDHVSGWVDFGAMDRDAASADLARLLGGWSLDASLREHAITSYRAVRALCEFEVRAVDAFERSTDLLMGARWVRWHFVERRGGFERQAVSERLEMSVARLEKGVATLGSAVHSVEPGDARDR